jgi:hypothetical protein
VNIVLGDENEWVLKMIDQRWPELSACKDEMDDLVC